MLDYRSQKAELGNSLYLSSSKSLSFLQYIFFFIVRHLPKQMVQPAMLFHLDISSDFLLTIYLLNKRGQESLENMELKSNLVLPQGYTDYILNERNSNLHNINNMLPYSQYCWTFSGAHFNGFPFAVMDSRHDEKTLLHG